MHKKRQIKAEAVVALAIFGLIATFFLAEMLMKPISGEDVGQQSCMVFAGWRGANECIDSVMSFIPRIGQVAHHVVIWQFHNLPTFGFETAIRLIDAIMSFAIVYIIAMIAVGGRKLRLTYKDAAAAAIAFILLILSPFTEMFFKGFSNVHNYVPAVLFTLLFGYFWFFKTKLRTKLGHKWYNVIFLLTGFLFASSTEMNSLVFFAILFLYSIWHLIRRTAKLSDLLKNLKTNYLFGTIGVLLGVVFIYIIGNGVGATIARSGSGYMNSLRIRDIFTNPLAAIPEFAANFIGNIWSYLPFLLLAIIAAIAYHYLTKQKKKRSEQHQAIQLSLIIPIIYAILYIGTCSSVSTVSGRLTAVAFCTLLIPITYLLLTTTAQLKNKHFHTLVVCLGSVILLMNIDNFVFLVRDLQATSSAIANITSTNCLDQNTIDTANIPTKSKIFRFPHAEPAFAHTSSSWYPQYYLVNRTKIPIKDTCDE